MTKIAEKGSTTKLLKVQHGTVAEARAEAIRVQIAKHQKGEKTRLRKAYREFGLWACVERGKENADITSFSATQRSHWAEIGLNNDTDHLNARIKRSLQKSKSDLDVDACYMLAERQAKYRVGNVVAKDQSKRMWFNSVGIEELTQNGVVAIFENATDIRKGEITAQRAVNQAITKALYPNHHYSDLVIFDDKSNDLVYARKVIREETNLEYSVLEGNEKVAKLRNLLHKKKADMAIKVLKLIGYGYTNQEIAKKLKISEKTVSQHVQTIRHYAIDIK